MKAGYSVVPLGNGRTQRTEKGLEAKVKAKVKAEVGIAEKEKERQVIRQRQRDVRRRLAGKRRGARDHGYEMARVLVGTRRRRKLGQGIWQSEHSTRQRR